MPDRPAGAVTLGWRDRIRRVIAPHRPHVAILLLAALVYLPSVWLRDAWNPDEPRYAQVAHEMVSSGEYVLPHLNGEVYAEKPPLFFWVSILASRLTGIPLESGPRLVSVIAAWLAMVLTFRIGLRLSDPETAWLTVLVLATSSMFVLHASTGVIDATLAMLVTGAILIGMKAREKSSPVLWLLFYLLTAAAVLTKGPVGFLLPAGVLLFIVLAGEGLGGLRALHPVWGIGMVLAVAAAWVVPAIAKGGSGYAETILWKQNIDRMFDPWHHDKPVYYFLKVFPASFLPWTFVMPTALFGAWRSLRGRERGWLRAIPTAAIWFTFVFLFFSLAESKKTRYLLPLFPAAALLVAIELRKALAGKIGSLRARLPIAAACLLYAVVGLAMALLPAAGPDGTGHVVTFLDFVPPQQAAGLDWLIRFPGGLLLILPGLAIAGASILALRVIRSDMRAALACLVLAMVVTIGTAHWILMPALDPVKSAEPVATIAERAAGPGGTIVLYGEAYQGMFNLALGRDRLPVAKHADLLEDSLTNDPSAVVIASQPDTEMLTTRIDMLRVVGCLLVGAEMFCASTLDQGMISASTVEPASAITLRSPSNEGNRSAERKEATVSSPSSSRAASSSP